MAKLYWAGAKDSDHWIGPHETVEACREDALAYDFLDEIWVAPIDAELDDEGGFWEAVAQYLLWSLDDLDERLAEEGWLDPEEPWLATSTALEDSRGELADALRKVLPPRPHWRCVDTGKAERVEL